MHVDLVPVGVGEKESRTEGLLTPLFFQQTLSGAYVSGILLLLHNFAWG